MTETRPLKGDQYLWNGDVVCTIQRVGKGWVDLRCMTRDVLSVPWFKRQVWPFPESFVKIPGGPNESESERISRLFNEDRYGGADD